MWKDKILKDQGKNEGSGFLDNIPYLHPKFPFIAEIL